MSPSQTQGLVSSPEVMASTQSCQLCWWWWESRSCAQRVIPLHELIIQRQAVRKLGQFSPQFPFFMVFFPCIAHRMKQDFQPKSTRRIGNTRYFCRKGTASSKMTLYFFPWKGITYSKANEKWANFDLLKRYTEHSSSAQGFKNFTFYHFWPQSNSPSSRRGG